MLSDFHTHTCFSADSDAPVMDMIRQAARLGMNELCITDHHDPDTFLPDKEFLLNFDTYLPAIRQAAEASRTFLRVGCGIELGLQLHIREQLDRLVRTHSFDFIIGSSHFIDGLDPFYPDFFEGRSEKEAYARYFEVTLNRVRAMDCFDVFGHLDYVVRYGPNQNQFYSFSDYQEYIDPILKVLIEKGKGLECNTGGLRYGLGHPNPSEDILRRYRKLGGEILTIGSDAHNPEGIGYQFCLLPELLADCGFRYYTVFHERKPQFLPLK